MLVTKLKNEQILTRDEFRELLSTDKYDEELFKTADEVRRSIYGTDVYIRGLIEFSNFCKNNCYYCGIRCDNKKAERYRLSKDEIMECCREGYTLGFRTFVLQGGEDPYFTDERFCDIISTIRGEFPDCAITISVGERSYESYLAYFNAGANRFLLRHETAEEEHYNKLHPEEMSLENRKRCLYDLKKIGYQVGSGFMVGSPYQAMDNIISDLFFLKELQPDMIGIGPYVNHKETPFKDFENGSVELTIRLISVLRLMFPYALLPATTALGTLAEDGRERGLKAGANVVMPNLSPQRFRKLYSIYDNKIATGEEAAQSRALLEKRVENAGYKVVTAVGHVKKQRDAAPISRTNQNDTTSTRIIPTQKTSNKCLVAMSGGVDSSVAAHIMKEKGYDCLGATMKLIGTSIPVDEKHACCSLEDIADAKKVCDALSMKHFVYDFSDHFAEKVVDKFVCAYENGATPNPCIECNRHLKFERLFKEAENLGCDIIATGHYARIEKEGDRYLLKKALDHSKDQSYVLYSLTKEQLARTVFPLGNMTKEEARSIAEENNLINAHKKDSQDICFVKDEDYTDFIRRYTGKDYPEGDFIDKDGNVLGTHKGIISYTVGQRKGLGLALPAPLYVCDIDIDKNAVILCPHEDLFSYTLTANDINLTAVDDLYTPMRVKAKIRYRHTPADATVMQIDEYTIRVTFDEPQRAITKGQAVVLYDGDTVIGGGTITKI